MDSMLLRRSKLNSGFNILAAVASIKVTSEAAFGPRFVMEIVYSILFPAIILLAEDVFRTAKSAESSVGSASSVVTVLELFEVSGSMVSLDTVAVFSKVIPLIADTVPLISIVIFVLFSISPITYGDVQVCQVAPPSVENSTLLKSLGISSVKTTFELTEGPAFDTIRV